MHTLKTTNLTIKLVASSLLAASVMLVMPAYALPPLPASFPVAKLTDASPGKPTYQASAAIEQWKINNNRTAMQEHAWRLFSALMRPVYNDNGATIRVYDTWYSIDEAIPSIGDPFIQFQGAPAMRTMARKLDSPSQQSPHRGAGFVAALSSPTDLAAPGDRTLTEAVVSDVKYSNEINKWIAETLIVPDASNARKVGAYNLQSKLAGGASALPFNDTKGVMIKPAYTIVKGNGPTVIGRWSENTNVVNPESASSIQPPKNANTRVAGERTWTKEAVVVPPGASLNKTFYGRDGSVLPVVSVSDFHYFKLTPAMVSALRSGILSELMGPNIHHIEVGDYAVLTSMHIATREVDDWTWQTFWWQAKNYPKTANSKSFTDPNNATLVERGVPNDLKNLFLQKDWKPLSYFHVGVGYDYLTPSGDPVISSNPYLEGAFGLKDDLNAVYGATSNTDGVNIFLRDALDKPIAPYVHEGNGLKTNCMTCHKAALYPSNMLSSKMPAGSQGKYPDYGKLTGTEDLFFGKLQTHFIWGLANKVTDRENP